MFQVSILPNAKGTFVCSMDKADGYQTLTKDEIMNVLASQMAGMASEEVVFGSYSAAGGKDIEEATKVVINMVKHNLSRVTYETKVKYLHESEYYSMYHESDLEAANLKFEI